MSSHSVCFYFAMEQHIGGCLHSVECSLENNLADSHWICFDFAMEQHVEGCLHSVVCPLENNFVSSVFWNLRYVDVVTHSIILVVIQAGVCHVVYVIFNCASYIFVCVVLWNLSILFLGVFTDYFSLLRPMMFTIVFCSQYIVSNCFCCLMDIYLCSI